MISNIGHIRIAGTVVSLLMAGAAIAADPQDCAQLRSRDYEPSSFPPYRVELKIFDCAEMTRDVADLDALDHDFMVMRARNYPLKKFREQTTQTDPPRKYSQLTSSSRLARFKRLVDAYYQP